MYYFDYGIFLNKAQMKAVCPGSQPVGTAVLPNYKLAFAGWNRKHRGATATLVFNSGERVRGAVYKITEADQKKLNMAMGAPGLYKQMNVNVFGADDEVYQAYTYVMTPGTEAGKPSTEYLTIIQQGYRDWRLF
ncbi:gamma-glutamylcyclotransferase family protein [Chloroflexota bacterium]